MVSGTGGRRALQGSRLVPGGGSERMPNPRAGRVASTNIPAPEWRSVWVMKFAVSGCFPAEAAGLSWTVTSQTARCRDTAPCPVHTGTGHQIGHSLIAARSPVMSIVAWIVLRRGAGLLASMLIPDKDLTAMS